MKMKLSILASAIFLMGLLAIGQACAQTETPAVKKVATVLSDTEIQKVIKDSISWFSAAQTASGRFNYEYAPFWDRYTEDDNMVRQTGVLYILGEILNRDKSDKYSRSIKHLMTDSISYFQDNTAKGEYNGKKFQCLTKDDKKCTMGGTSLALVGMINLVQKYPELEKDYLPLMTDYASYIVAMRNEGKGFKENYYLIGEQSDTETTFSNGEAFLALVRYDQYKPSDAIKTLINDSYNYFSDIYGKNHDNNFYLWGMAAIKDLNAKNPDKKYFDFVKKYTDERMKPYKNRRQNDSNVGAYIEGITSAYSIMEKSLTEAEKKVYIGEINYWLMKTKDLQIQSDTKLRTKYGTSEDTYYLRVKNNKKAVGGFLASASEPYQRIDFTQHAVSAYLQKLVDIDGGAL